MQRIYDVEEKPVPPVLATDLNATSSTVTMARPDASEAPAPSAQLPAKKGFIGDRDTWKKYAVWNTNPRGNTAENSKPSRRSFAEAAFATVEQYLNGVQHGEELNAAIPSSPSHLSLSKILGNPVAVRYCMRQLSDSKSPSRIIDLFRLLLAHGISLSGLHDKACGYLAHAGRWDAMLAVTRHAKEQKLCTVALLNWHARASLEQKNYAFLETTLDDFATFALEPDARTYRLLLSGSFENHNLPYARRVLADMESRGLVNASILAKLARESLVGRDETIEERAISMLEHYPDQTRAKVLNALIRGHLQRGEDGRVLRLLSLFDPESVEILTEILHGDSDGHHHHHDPSFPQPLLEPIIPDTSTFYMFMYHFGVRRRDLGSALRLLQYFVTSGMTPDETIIAVLVDTCFICKRPDLAVQLIAGTCEDTTPSNLFEALLPGSLSGPRFEVHVPAMVPTTFLFNALFKGILDIRGLDGGRIVLEIMALNKVKPDDFTVKQLLQYATYEENLHPRTLVELLQTLSTGSNSQATRAHLRRVLRSIQAKLEFQIHGKGWNTLRNVVKRGPSRHPVPENRLMTSSPSYDAVAGVRAPLYHKYRALLQFYMKDFEERRIEPDADAFLLRITHEAVIECDTRAASRVIKDMSERGLHPDARHFGALMHGHALSGNFQKAKEIMRKAEWLGIAPTVVMFTTLMNAAARQGRPLACLVIFQRMVSLGITPDIPSIDVLASAFYAVGWTHKARDLLIENWHYSGHSFPEEYRMLHVADMAKRLVALGKKQGVVPAGPGRPHTLDTQLEDLMRQWKSGSPTS